MMMKIVNTTTAQSLRPNTASRHEAPNMAPISSMSTGTSGNEMSLAIQGNIVLK